MPTTPAAALSIPYTFSATVIRRAGQSGRDWLKELPQRIRDICQDWQLSLTGRPMYGHLSLVYPVRQGQQRYALKLVWPDPSNAHEALALKTWAGEGAVKLFAYKEQEHALLLEDLEGQRSLEQLPDRRAIELIAGLYNRLFVAAPDGLIPQQQMAAQMQEAMEQRWEYLKPCPKMWLDKALTLCTELTHTIEHYLVNYDIHDGNVLAGCREPWLVIDPKVISGEKAFGFAQLLWCRLDLKEADSLEYRFEHLLEVCELDPERARGWLYVRCLDYWLWALTAGLTIDPVRCAFIIDWLERTGKKQ